MNAVQTPIAIEVRLTCPNCGNLGTTVLELGSELRIREDDVVDGGDVEQVTISHDGRTVDAVTGEVIE